ncbi:Cyclin-dependent kinase 6 [Trebouxia sp. C0010 RCD-2024]
MDSVVVPNSPVLEPQALPKGEEDGLDKLQREIHSAVIRAASAEKQAQSLQDLLKQLASRDDDAAHLPTSNGTSTSAQHEQALAAHRSALQQEVEQLRAQLKQQASNHAAEAQKFQVQLDSSRQSKEAALAELHTQSAHHTAICDELNKELEGLKGKLAELMSSQFASLNVVGAADNVSPNSCLMLLVLQHEADLSLRKFTWMPPPRTAVLAPSDALDHLPQGERNDLDRLKMVLQQSANRAGDVDSKEQHLGVQQQLAATEQEAASMDDMRVLVSKDAPSEESSPASRPDQRPQSLTAESAAAAPASQKSEPAASEVREVVSQAISQAGCDDNKRSCRKANSEPSRVGLSGGPKWAKKGKKTGTARQQAVVAIQATSASAGTPATITQNAEALHPKDAILEGSLPHHDQAPQSLTAASDHLIAIQSSVPAASEVREVVSQAASQAAAAADHGKQEAAPPAPANMAPHSSQPRKAKKGKKGNAKRQAVAAGSAPGSVTQDMRVLVSKDAPSEESSPASRPDQRPQSLTAESAAAAPASQKSEPAASEVREVAKKGKKTGTARQQAVVAIQATSASAGTPVTITQAATVREASSAAARSQAVANLARLQCLIADLNRTCSAAVASVATTQNAEALHPKDAILEGSLPHHDQAPQSLTAASDHLIAIQRSVPAASEVREVVSQAASQAAAAADHGKQEAAPPAPANIAPHSSQPRKAKKGKKGNAKRQAVAAGSAPGSVTQAGSPGKEDSCPATQSSSVPRGAQDLAADLGQRFSDAVPSAAPAQAVSGLVVPESGGKFDASSTLSPAQGAAPTPAVAPPSSGPQKLASTWWSSHVKGLQRLAGLGKKQVTGTAVLESVPNAPAYHWPADPTLRQIGSGGQGTVHYAERWSVDSTNGRVKKRAAALKVVPCATQQQAALLDREAANLRALQWQSMEGHQVTAPYAPALLDVVQQTAGGQGILAMSLVEGQLLDEFMSTALEKQTPRQFVETVAQVLQKLLQVLADLHSRNRRSFNDLKPENILMAGGRQLVLIDWCSSRDRTQEAVEGAPSTLGYPSPEVTALGHGQQPSVPLDLHKDDVWAVGVMGLLWLSKGQDMPFGPTRHQAERLASPEGLAETREGVMAQHSSWAQAHPGSADMAWPAKLSKLLEKVKDPAVREQAGAFFLALLHPNVVERVTASKALELAFVR